MIQGVPQGAVCSPAQLLKVLRKSKKQTKQKLQVVYILQFFQEIILCLKKALIKKEQNEENYDQELHGFGLAVSV